MDLPWSLFDYSILQNYWSSKHLKLMAGYCNKDLINGHRSDMPLLDIWVHSHQIHKSVAL